MPLLGILIIPYIVFVRKLSVPWSFVKKVINNFLPIVIIVICAVVILSFNPGIYTRIHPILIGSVL